MSIQNRARPLPFLVTTELPCPYLPDRMERKIVTELAGPAAKETYETLARAGFRRSHAIAYRPACRGCQACVPVRIVAGELALSRTLQRIEKRNLDLTVTVEPSRATGEQFRLFSRYLEARHHDGEMLGMTGPEYESMVETSPLDSRLIEFRDGQGQLIAGCLSDWTRDSISAVYSFFEPGQPQRSLGNYIVIWLAREAARRQLPYVYLGYWVAGSRKMAYKNRFRPLEGYGPAGWLRLP